MGLSEFELIQKLRLNQAANFIGAEFSDNLTLFQSHFLLFHHLYHLQSQLWSEQQSHLEISPLKIRLSDYRKGENHLQQHALLQDYYLDTSNLVNTTSADVDKMLDNFWRCYLSPAERESALNILGLQDPVDDQTIKHSYRKLAMEHHPDRGGDKERLQSLNEAIHFLLG